MKEICVFCGLSFEEILASGQVGCEKCYEISDLRKKIGQIYAGKKHKNRAYGESDEF